MGSSSSLEFSPGLDSTWVVVFDLVIGLICVRTG